MHQTILAMAIAATLTLALAATLALPAFAQDHSGHGADQPYAGMQDRPIKALTDKRIDGLLTGKGIGYALAAELNHYPGPRHALDMADGLGLSEDQQSRIRALFYDMEARAIALGKEIVAAEEELDGKFESRQIDRDSLQALVGRIADLEGKLRFVHLATHLDMREILSHHQVVLYDRMRGYDSD